MIIGIFIGVTFFVAFWLGYFTCVLMIVAKESDKEIEE